MVVGLEIRKQVQRVVACIQSELQLQFGVPDETRGSQALAPSHRKALPDL